MSGRFDAIVIGGSTGGLAAASCLRQTGASVLLLEAGDVLGNDARRVPVLHALDPKLVKTLGLTRRGLKFSGRDLPLVGLRQDGRHIVLGRDPHPAARAIAAHSPEDAIAYRRYQADVFALARQLRAWWWDAAESPSGLPQRYEAMSAQALLASYFETEALKTTLACDVPAPLVPGSALVPVWRAAQEMCGQQGAVAMPQGGGAALADALVAAGRDLGVEFRSKARAAKLILDGNRAVGVELDGGEQVFARAVLSSLSRRKTILELAPAASAGFAETHRLMAAAPAQKQTHIVFTLNAAPEFPVAGPARYVIAEGEPSLEAIVMPSPVAGQHVLIVRAKGTADEDKIIAQLERFAPRLRGRIVGRETRLCDAPAMHLLSPAKTRIATTIEGLFLCGADAEPMAAVSGRAGRLAADFAMRPA
jgi:phytoene dehydrogenase-like protein